MSRGIRGGRHYNMPVGVVRGEGGGTHGVIEWLDGKLSVGWDMNTLTLAWERCDLCGRRGITIRCVYGGEALNLCPYCLSVAYPRRGLSCKQLYAVIPSLKSLVNTPNSDLINRVGQLITSKSTSRSSRRVGSRTKRKRKI